ncbi:MAG: twin-arginine translocase TatA/TatE family subunit [Deltaproteobacteria bacterium]|nr:twin-arginine translocase TatA/TatE family subunit [Deltaproteobacteria bacterium]MBI2500700.1 twin-arginine translocase TatA/TatE family subunit [Deltaproteobacteria bacterium]MBI4196195.1 twin-arginine translocase TatA/TatE family subunit [Deltaproteobacteria bacterium]
MHPDIPIIQAGLGGLGPWEIGLVVVIVLLVFGAGKLPGIGSSLGQAIKNFKKTIKGEEPGDDAGKKP